MNKKGTILVFNGTYDELSQVVHESCGLCIVVFHAIWCLPSSKLLEDLPMLSGNNINVTYFTVDIDHNQELVEKFDIQIIPNTKFFYSERNNELKELDSVTGYNKDLLLEKVNICNDKIMNIFNNT